MDPTLDPMPFTPSPGVPYRLADLHPMRDRLLVAPLAVPSRTRSGLLHLAETSHERERPQHGIVMKTGPGAYNKALGTVVPLQVREGDCIFYGKYSGQEFALGEQRLLNMSEAEVFAVLPAGAFRVVSHENSKDDHLEGDWCDLCATPEELAARARLDEERRLLVESQVAAAGAPALAPVSADPAVEQEAAVSLEAERERLRQRRQVQEAQ